MSDADPTGLMARPAAPFPGLRPFEPNEWPIFCGRERTTLDVIARLGDRNLVLVHGGSGCGKSSLVRAGVIPTIDRDHRLAGRKFVHAIMRPSEGPLTALDRLLTDKLGPVEGGWAQALIFPDAIVERIEKACETAGIDTFCLLIDQFEESFRWARECGREDVQLMTDVLARVSEATASRFFALLTMRSDYLGDCAQFGGLATIINDCQFFLPNLDERGLLRSIVDPPKLFGGSIDQALANKLRFAASAERDPLPTLQHLLMRMTERKRAGGAPWDLTIEDFDEARRGSGALSAHADALFAAASGGDAATEADMAWVFRSLVDRDVGGRGIRRPCSIGELSAVSGLPDAALDRVVATFSAEGANLLVVSDPGPGPEDRRVDISHEALIRNWRRMTGADGVPGWLQQELDDALIWQTLAISARTAGALLDGVTLVEREAWFAPFAQHPARARRYLIRRGEAVKPEDEPEWQSVVALLKRSRTAVDKEAAERAKRAARAARTRLIVRWILGIFLTVVAVLAALIYIGLTVENDANKNLAAQADNAASQATSTAIDLATGPDAAGGPSPVDTVTDEALNSLSPVLDTPTVENTADGFMWIGSRTNNYLKVPGTGGAAVAPDRIKVGARYEATDNIVLRTGPPNKANQSQQAINVVPRGATLVAAAVPVTVMGASGTQYWLAVRAIRRPTVMPPPDKKNPPPPPALKQPRIVLHYGTINDDKAVRAMIDGLRARGFPTDEKPQVLAEAKGFNQIRYCHSSDSVLADKVLNAVYDIRPTRMIIRAIDVGKLPQCRSAAQGTIEIWLSVS